MTGQRPKARCDGARRDRIADIRPLAPGPGLRPHTPAVDLPGDLLLTGGVLLHDVPPAALALDAARRLMAA